MNEQEQREQLAKELMKLLEGFNKSYPFFIENYPFILDFIFARETGLKDGIRKERDQTNLYLVSRIDTLTQQLSAEREAFDNLLIECSRHLTPRLGHLLNALAASLATPPQADSIARKEGDK